ncbi:stalk domain-containing protein [Peribacillus loiseleuriae]|uniref:stalk domain-containing protein n=1 Tax=Peribacillus loiseleuriae TaxID=1679170 RepID=UPI003D049AF3
MYAGNLISSYKTPRGNIASVEQESIHKNRIGLTVNGKVVKGSSWYHDTEKTYVPLRAVSEMLGATVNYNDKTMSADINLDVGKYSKEDLVFLQLLTEFNYTLDRVDIVAGTFNDFYTGLSLASDEFHLYNRHDFLDEKVNDFNEWITNYNELIDVVAVLMDKANRMGLLLESDFMAFDS